MLEISVGTLINPRLDFKWTYFSVLQFPRSDAKSHSQTHIESHLSLALRVVDVTQQQVNELVTAVKEQSQQIERMSGQIDRQSQQIRRQSQEIQRQSQQLDQISKDKEQSEKTKTSMSTVPEQPINEIFPTSFEWKIPNIRQLLLRSVSGKQSLFSEPFDLFRCGYKYLLKIEMRKSGWDFLLHVYIKVVPGKFDESLSWPCKEKVRATLVNQNTLSVSYIDNQGNKSKVIDFEKGQVPCYRPLHDDYHEYRLILEINLTDLPHDYYKINDTIFLRVNRE